MKTSCEIIKDLLPLYYDGVCNSESRALVAEHLKECQSCKKLLAVIAEEITRPVNAADEARPIRAIQAAWKKDKKKSLFKGGVISFLLCAVIVGGGLIFLTQARIVPVPADVLDVWETYRLSDGRLVFKIVAEDMKELRQFEYTVEADGSVYLQAKRPVICFDRPYETGLAGVDWDVDIAALNAEQQAKGTGTVITAYYIGTSDNHILLWEEGMEIAAANEYDEHNFLQENSLYSQMLRHRLEYIGDNAGVEKLLSFLPQFDENYVQNMFALQTDSEPYGLTIYYEPSEKNSGGKEMNVDGYAIDGNGLEMNIGNYERMGIYAEYLFDCVDNLGYVEYAYRTAPSDNELDESAYTVLSKFERP